jgi:hypothetical protein
MGLLAGRPHSTGALYIMINDLLRGVRFLQRNIICYTVLPGPSEPSLEQLNHILEPFSLEIAQLQAGKLLIRTISRRMFMIDMRCNYGHI